MSGNDLQTIKERIYEEGLVEQILEALECEYIRPVGSRYEAQLPDRFYSNKRRSVQVYLTESLPSKVRSKSISGDIFMLVGYILYECETQDDLSDYLFQCKAFICNLFGWHEYLTPHELGDDFSEVVEKKDHLLFLRPIQKDRKKRKRTKIMRDKENIILDKDSVFSWYRNIPHENFLLDGVNIKTQRIFEVMFDETSERVVFPIYNHQGELVSIKGRYVGNDEWVLDEIKYLYLYSFDKGIELFNLHKARQYIEKTGEVIVFESEKSCMKAWQYGWKNTVSISGSELSPVQAHMLIMLGVNIVFALDNDMDEDHVRKQSKQIKTRQCFWIKDNLGLLKGKDAPVDKGEIVWERLVNDCRRSL